jgi:zinc transport system substrate-binding protein
MSNPNASKAVNRQMNVRPPETDRRGARSARPTAANIRGVIRRASVALLLLVLAAAGLTGVGCLRRAAAPPRVAATVFPLYDLVRRVAGDRLEVSLVLPAGADPHGYEPRPRDVAALSDAGLVFAVGLGLDPWAQGMARAAGAGEARVFELGPLMDPILAPAGVIRQEPFIDAHFWTDPVRALRAVDVIVDALSGLDPAGAPFFRERAQDLRRSIEAAHKEVAARAASWPRRRIVTFHGSLFYFAARYGLQVVGVVEPVPGTEPTAQHVQAVVELLRGPQPAALFVEPQLDGQLARSIAREAGVGVHEVDGMGGSTATGSYEDMLRGIARSMDEALR